MPNLKLFRRRSSGNALDLTSEPQEPAQSSFRVLERPKEASHTFDGPAQKRLSYVGRPFNSPLQHLKGGSEERLGYGLNRGSGGTTNSGSSEYYMSSSASARHSSSSTLPSSVDQEREPEHEELYPRKAATTPMNQSVSAHADEPLPPPPSFTTRAARALSFTPKHGRTNSIPNNGAPTPPSPTKAASRSPEATHSTIRDRSMTSSSYASTAKPNQPELNYTLGSTNFGDGDDFGNMFDGIGKKSREDLSIPSPSANGGFHRTESEPMYPPRAMSRQAFTPSPNLTRNARADPGSPYSHDGRGSVDGLMSGSALSSPKLFDEGPPVPSHGNGIAAAFLGRGQAAYSRVPERNPSPGFERTSSDSQTGFISDDAQEKDNGFASRQTQLDDGDRWSRKVDLRDPQKQSLSNAGSYQSFETASSHRASQRNPRTEPQATAGAARAGAASRGKDEEELLFGQESSSATPRAAKLAVQGLHDEPLFDSSPLGPPSRAIKPGHQRTESGTPKRMTRAQFEALQKSGNSSLEHSEDEKHEDGEYDDEDDIERSLQATKQRRKQQATMAVYRQQMKKSTGGGLADLPNASRPPMDRASSSAVTGMSSLHLGGLDGTPPPDAVRGKASEDDDEDVPLGILQAHGFPSANRPPTSMGQNDQQRLMSMAGSVANGGAGQGSLPPFARRLPADPYFGASLVNPANRESLAFSSAQSAYGGAPAMTPPPQMGQPGGLVGVIASEERAKAMRRGSPNQYTGTYGSPLPSNMPGQMPQMPRTMSMGSTIAPQVYTPSGYMPGMPPMPQMPMMPMMPQTQTEQQMQQFMQMQMQVMQNMQNMLAMQQQTMGGTPQSQQQTPDYLGVPVAGQRPMSMAGQGRAMTMMNPPSMWDLAQGQQRPASAMPAGYAPSVMNGGGPGPGYTPSIAPSERSNVGLPPRYRPVNTAGDAPNGRSHSMTSSLTLQAFTNQQEPESRAGQQKSTIRIIDKPKGSPKVSSRPVDPDEDEDDGWAELAKKRAEKKFGWRKKDSGAGQEPALSDLYKDY